MLQLNQCQTLYVFFYEHGKACFVPTDADGPCYIGFEPGTEIRPGTYLVQKLIVEVHVKLGQKFTVIQSMILYINLASTLVATNGYTRGNSTNVSNKDRTNYETAHVDGHRSQSDFLSAKRELDTTVKITHIHELSNCEIRVQNISKCARKLNSVSWP